MTDSEKLDLLLQKSSSMEKEMETFLQQNMEDLKAEQASMRHDMKKIETSLKQNKNKTETALEQDLVKMETALRRDMEELKAERISLEQNMEKIKISLKQNMDKIKALLKQSAEKIEIIPNISIIAEGHLELSRKLNECIHISSDIKAKQEILDVFINMQKTNNRLMALG